MRSIRTKITALTLAAILISILSFGLIGIYFIRAESRQMSAQTLSLICENRKDSLNDYLNSIEQSVNMISRYAIDSLDGVTLTEGGVLGASGSGIEEIPGRSDAQRKKIDQYLDEHLDFIESAFESVANHTNGIASCYYRINPEITTCAKGFFFSKKGNFDFQKRELTDIAAYDPDDIDHVGWYFIPLKHGRASWIDPYHSAKLDEQVISYVVPIYKAGTFIGVIGMDIRFDTLVTQIQQFTNFETGFFALTDEDGRIYYHPEFEMGTELNTAAPQLRSMVKDMRQQSSLQELIRYDRKGRKWQMTYTTIANGMKLAAAVEESEINIYSNNLTKVFVITGVLIIMVFVAFTTISMKSVTRPLENLTNAAKQLADGDYDAKLDYESSDEVGILTSTFSMMRDTLKAHFNDLSAKAFRDDLTGVKSKHAFVEAEGDLDRRIDDHTVTEFALALFDLNGLKEVNDTRGHEAGDRYIKEASRIICTRFKHSPVYRIGGDEFVAILEGDDYEKRDELFAAFEKQMDDDLAQGRLTIASGCSCFDPALDKSSHTVLERADDKMYQRKRKMKEQGSNGG